MSDGLPFIPAALDDLGLDVHAFRVYAHACRRAGAEGLFFGGGVNVARTCRMSVRQLRRAVAELRRLGLLEVVEARAGCATTYRTTTADRCPVVTGAPQSPVTDRHPTGATQAPEPVPHRHTEGTPVKVLPEGTPSGSPAARPSRAASKGSKPKATTTATAAGKVVAVDLLLPGDTSAWSREACDDWHEATGGTAPGGRIGRALKPLVTAHGWDVVRPVWRRFLASKDAKFGAEYFASRFGLIAHGGDSLAARNARVLGAWLESKGEDEPVTLAELLGGKVAARG